MTLTWNRAGVREYILPAKQGGVCPRASRGTHLEVCGHEGVQPARHHVQQSGDGLRGVRHSQSCRQSSQDGHSQGVVSSALVKGLAATALQEGGQDGDGDRLDEGGQGEEQAALALVLKQREQTAAAKENDSFAVRNI